MFTLISLFITITIIVIDILIITVIIALTTNVFFHAREEPRNSVQEKCSKRAARPLRRTALAVDLYALLPLASKTQERSSQEKSLPGRSDV
jgi:uncharacterized protein YggT (Ycf19 family)